MQTDKIENDLKESEFLDQFIFDKDLVSRIESFIRLTTKREQILYFLWKNSTIYPFFMLKEILEYLDLIGVKHDRGNIENLLKKMEKKEFIKRYKCTDCNEVSCRKCPYEKYRESLICQDKRVLAKYVITIQEHGKRYFRDFIRDINNCSSLLNQDMKKRL